MIRKLWNQLRERRALDKRLAQLFPSLPQKLRIGVFRLTARRHAD